MSRFDFMSDGDLRAIVESDYEELKGCMTCGASKATLVLAGSIAESVLSDYLISLPDPKWSREKVLEADLAKIISRAHELEVITDETEKLSTVLREYRNLIHPGRLARRADAIVSPEKATIALAVTEVIIDAVSTARATNMGLTADQLISKILGDASCMSIVGHLVRQMEPRELDRLVSIRLPEVYLQREYAGSDWDVADQEQADKAFAAEQNRLRVCYQRAFELATEPAKREAMAWLARTVATEPSRTVTATEDAFIFPSVWPFLASDGDAQLVAEHVLNRLAGASSELPSDDALATVAQNWTHANAGAHLDYAVWRALRGRNGDLADKLAVMIECLPEGQRSKLEACVDAQEAAVTKSLRAADGDQTELITETEAIAKSIRAGAFL